MVSTDTAEARSRGPAYSQRFFKSKSEVNKKSILWRIEVKKTGKLTEKTLVECLRYMLNNEVATDVCFSLETPDGGTTETIRAHKAILTSRSPVFERMFTSVFAESRRVKDDPIRITDINNDTFKALLRFIYTDDVAISPEEAPSLMYAANKYMIPKLHKECSSLIIDTSINVKNVCFLLDQSLLFCEENLTDHCLAFISCKSDMVLKSKGFLESSRQAVEAILKNETLSSSESVVRESCVNWAKHQLKPIKNPSDEHVRETLGCTLYDICFAAMNPEGSEDNADKKHVCLNLKRGSPDTCVFNAKRRSVEERCVDRTCTFNVKSGSWNRASGRHSISFTTDKDVKLSGLGLFTGFDGNSYGVDIEIQDSRKSLFKKNFIVPFTGNSEPVKISFDSLIGIRTGVRYTIFALAYGDIGY